MTWTLKGTYFESCNCEVACPCLFLSPPTEGECTALVGWHIEDGDDDGVSLSGLNIALAVHSPGHMAKTQWTVAVYVDSRADAEQNASLMKIFSGQGGGHPARLATHIGAIAGVRSVPIEFTVADGKHALKIPEIADVEIETMTGQGDGPITISGHPLCIAPGFPATAAKSSKLVYNDHGMAWNLSEKTGVFSPFAYQGDQ
ncbi:DUF1326 domain-containing protein [Roseibium aggregatum]|uniref:DUF1326 domain-containing protein n=1 Tax=Roseibium aggregatum TaxID=187304 RepID=A0A926P3K4_9HYPH|nr:DUF1326 domain-containing protein [Roseibium aggregatum]MBD1546017.1 DUF1326 domain-containing protein [Roseibium aggregatum]